jgi:hypothetical protein
MRVRMCVCMCVCVCVHARSHLCENRYKILSLNNQKKETT